MVLEGVKREIITEAEGKAKEKILEAEKRAEEIKVSAEEEVSEYSKHANLDVERARVTMERKQLATARFDAQRLVSNTKREAIDNVMNCAKDKISSFDTRKRKKILTELLGKTKQEIDVQTIFVAKRDLALLKGKNVQEADISGGLIAESKDGRISVNLSVEEMLDSIREEIVVDVSEVLFDGA